MSLEGKVALVTGAGFGIGRATAIELAGRGARVLAVDFDLPAVRETVAMIRAAGHAAGVEAFGVSVAAELEIAVASAVDTYGALHYAVNNFSSDSDYCRLDEMEMDGWQQTIDRLLTSIWLSMKYEIPAIKGSGGGSIVNVASPAGIASSPGLSALGAAKAGVISLSKSAAAECALEGVRINAISPGGVLTDGLASLCASEPGLRQTLIGDDPAGRLAGPEEIAACICFMCSDEASYMSGENMVVDGGRGMAATS